MPAGTLALQSMVQTQPLPSFRNRGSDIRNPTAALTNPLASNVPCDIAQWLAVSTQSMRTSRSQSVGTMDSGSLAGMTALFCVPGNPRYRGCRQPALPWLPLNQTLPSFRNRGSDIRNPPAAPTNPPSRQTSRRWALWCQHSTAAITETAQPAQPENTSKAT